MTDRPWVCRYCGRDFGADSVNEIHETKCAMRVEEEK